MSKILIIEDEESILMALEDDLSLEGHAVTGETDGVRALERAKMGGYDLIILDIMLPGMDGFDICRQLRGSGDTTPILVLTAKGQEVDKVLGLELGADDYVTKPFSRRELLARVKALLRRADLTDQPLALESLGEDLRRLPVALRVLLSGRREYQDAPLPRNHRERPALVVAGYRVRIGFVRLECCLEPVCPRGP